MKAFFQDIEAEIGQLNGSQKEPETVNKTTSSEIFENILLSLKKRFAHFEGLLYLELLDMKKNTVFAHNYICDI